MAANYVLVPTMYMYTSILYTCRVRVHNYYICIHIVHVFQAIWQGWDSGVNIASHNYVL